MVVLRSLDLKLTKEFPGRRILRDHLHAGGTPTPPKKDYSSIRLKMLVQGKIEMIKVEIPAAELALSLIMI